MFLANLGKKIIGSRNERLVKKFSKQVKLINQLEETISQLSDEDLRAKTDAFKQSIQQGEALEAILPEAFAVVREASKRHLGMRHFDVQLIGGMALNAGKISEMRTGEGKTLMSTLAAYLNALTGKGVHIVTVNDYLARRDAEWMEPIYAALGLTVGVIGHGMDREEKQAAYNADITYGTNNEFGFDYLRDNMAFTKEEQMQRPLNFAIVDEVDSILIDEARTPLIISGAAEDSSELYKKMDQLIPKLTEQKEKEGPGDYSLDEKNRQAHLTEDGHETVEKLLIEAKLLTEGSSLYDAANIPLMHHVLAGLRAHALFKKDVDYIVKNNDVVIVDEHTGRTMPGRRWSDGLHQAVEAKEGVQIQSENQTLASITFQNYFRLYEKLSGMTGTADTEAFEFQQIYNLEVVVIPTNKPNQRKDLADIIYMTQEEKFEAILKDIKDCAERKQPVLVGTISIETSEFLSKYLKKQKIDHQVLNAKFHEQEAHIVAEAGRPGQVTIATNMAGRGTDIVLGGNLEAELRMLEDASEEEIQEAKENWQQRHDTVLQAGGLHIIGTERHESRRIDNQLRGRSGRQGDPGSTQFYLSLKDNLMRIFVSDKISGMLGKLGMEKGEAITHPWVSRAIENAQRKVEGHNFDIRKQLLEYDNVANDQRKVIYQQRSELMAASDVSATIEEIRQDTVEALITEHIPPNSLEESWRLDELMHVLETEFGQKLAIKEWLDKDDKLHEEGLRQKIIEHFNQIHQEKIALLGVEDMRHLEKVILLNVLDSQWKEHLATMDYLRQSIHLRGYAQKDPKQEYKREAFNLFVNMLDSIKREVASLLAVLQVEPNTDVQAVDENMRRSPVQLDFKHDEVAPITDTSTSGGQDPLAGDEAVESQGKITPFVREQPKVGRNDPCPCGSGKKFKQCHGKLS